MKPIFLAMLAAVLLAGCQNQSTPEQIATQKNYVPLIAAEVGVVASQPPAAVNPPAPPAAPAPVPSIDTAAADALKEALAAERKARESLAAELAAMRAAQAQAEADREEAEKAQLARVLEEARNAVRAAGKSESQSQPADYGGGAVYRRRGLFRRW